MRSLLHWPLVIPSSRGGSRLPRALALLLFTLFLLAGARTRAATTQTWGGGTSTDWNTAANWNAGAGPVPGTSDTAIIPTGKPKYPSLTTAANNPVSALTIDAGGALTNATGGSVSVSSTFTLNGTLVMSGGTLSIKDFASGTGTFTMTAGLFKISRDFKFTSFSATGGTVEWTGPSSAASFPAGSYQFFNVLIDAGVNPGFDRNAANTYQITGNWTNNGAPSLIGMATTLKFNGTSAQYVAGTSQTASYNLQMANSAGLTLVTNLSVNGGLTFTSGKITTGSKSLILANAANTVLTNAGSSRYVIGNVQKNFAKANGQSFTFPIGDASNYTPITLASLNVRTAGNLKASTTTGDHPQIAASGIDAATSVNRYWTLTNSPSGIAVSTCTATFNFVAGDLDAGANTAAFAVRRYNGSWNATTNGMQTSTNTAASFTAFGDFAIGDTQIDHYLVYVSGPHASGGTFTTTVTAQDVANQTVTSDSNTLVTITSSGNAVFDSNGDGTFVDNTKSLSSGTFTISTLDDVAETITLTATDENGSTGTSTNVVISQNSGDYRSAQSGNWTNVATWQTNNGSGWFAAARPPTNTSASVILIQSGHAVTNISNLTLDQVAVLSGGQLTVNSNTTITLNNGTGNDLEVESGGTLVMLGTGAIAGAGGFVLDGGASIHIGSTAGISSSGASGSIQNTGTRYFDSAANYTYNGTAVQSSGSGLATVNNLTINNSAGVTLTTNAIVNGTLTLTSGALSGATNLTLADGAIISRATGSLSGTPTFANMVNLTYTGSSAVTTGPEIPADPTAVNNLTNSNTGGVTLTTNVTVNGTLALSSGVIATTTTNQLTVANTDNGSAVVGTGWVNGTLLKSFDIVGNPQSFTFPIGGAASYRPVALSGLNVATAGTLAALVTSGQQPNINTSGLDATRDVSRYWTLTTDGNLALGNTYSATFTFVAGDVTNGAASTAQFVIRRYSSGWNTTTTGTQNPTNTSASGIDGFGDFAIGDQLLVHYAVTAATPQTAGATFSTTVTAQDLLNQTVLDSSTVVTMSSSSGHAQFDSNGGGTFGDNAKTLSSGTFTINTRDNTAENVVLTATDANSKTGTSSSIAVNPGAFAKLQVLMPGEAPAPGTASGKTGTPSAQTVGTAFNVTVNAVDANWNAISTNDTVAITSSDSNATLPANAALSNGTQTFSVTFKTSSTQTVTALDVTQPGIMANTGTAVTVNAGSQTVTFGAIADQLTTNTVKLYATASSGLTVTFAVTSGPGSISNGTNLTFTAAGSVTITASQSGNTNWNAAPNVSRSFNVNGLPVPSSPTLQRWPLAGSKVRGSKLLGTDPDGDLIWLVSVGPSSAQGGTITTNATWVFYAPATGFTNADSYAYIVSDSRGGTNGGTVTVNLSANAGPTQNYTIEDLGNGSVNLHFSAIPGRTYAIQYTDSLAPASWQALVTRTADASGQFTRTDSPPGGPNSRYYRTINIAQ